MKLSKLNLIIIVSLSIPFLIIAGVLVQPMIDDVFAEHKCIKSGGVDYDKYHNSCGYEKLIDGRMMMFYPDQDLGLPILTEKSYTYNSICDIGGVKQFMIEKVWSTHTQITSGYYNDDPIVINFIKTNEFFPGLTPDELFFIPKQNSSTILGPSTDPIMFDVGLLMPLTLQILNVNPELIEILLRHGGESNFSYAKRISSELDKCN